MNRLNVHLTNVAIAQKYGPNNGAHPDQSLMGGSKMTLKMLQQYLSTRNISFGPIWTQIQEIIVKTFLSAQYFIPNQQNAFELFGFDIFLDQNLKCWLIECNSSPSLARETVLDELVKQTLVDDIVDLVGIVPFDRKKLVEVLDRKLREEMGMKGSVNTKQYS